MLVRLLIIAILGLFVRQARAEVLIDDFTSGPVTLSGASASQNQPGLSGVLGGHRFIGWNGAFTRPSPGTPTTVSMSVDTSGGGSFLYDGSPNRTATNFELRYDGGSVSPPGMNVDLGTNDVLAIDFGFANFSPGFGSFDILVLSNNSGVTGGGSGFVRVNNSDTPFTLLFPLSGAGSTLDIHHLSRLSIGTSNGNLPGSFAINSIRAVPEPGSFVFGFALIALTLRRRR